MGGTEIKKLLCLLLVLGMIFSLSACRSAEPAPAPTPAPDPVAEPTPAPAVGGSPAQNLLAEFHTLVAQGAGSAEAIASELVMSGQIPFKGVSMPVEPGWLNGFTQEIAGFAAGATFAPMIGAIPFVGYVFELEEGADPAAFIQTLRDSADLRWNVCTEADELVCDSDGSYVFFVMSPATFEEEADEADLLP